MRLRDYLAFAALITAAPVYLVAQTPAAGGQKPGAPGGQPPRPALTLATTAFADGDDIPAKYTQAGEQVSPALTWTNVPLGTQSFVLHMGDPDVACNKTTKDQVHWLVWNIPGDATGLPEGVPKGEKLPDGSQQISASGPVYRGPAFLLCFPTLLSTLLSIPPAAAGSPRSTREAVPG